MVNLFFLLQGASFASVKNILRPEIELKLKKLELFLLEVELWPIELELELLELLELLLCLEVATV